MYTANHKIVRGVIGILGLAALSAIAGTAMWMGYFATHPWLQAGLQGGLIGLVGSTLFVSVSWVLDIFADERRSREVLALCHDRIGPRESAVNVPATARAILLARLQDHHDPRVAHPHPMA